MPSSFFTRGGWWVLGQSVLLVALLALSPWRSGDWSSRTGFWLGVMLLGAGAVFGIAGTRALGRNRTPYPRPLVGGELVQRGIYALVRHPLYASLIYLGAGWALVWASGAAGIAATALTVLLDCKARLEERWLVEAFPGYTDYARRVRRLVPGLY